MAVKRITFKSQTVAKIRNMATKKGNEWLLEGIRSTRVSEPPGGGLVLWDPDKEFAKKLSELLAHEETFVRKRNTCSHKALLQAIEDLKQHAES